MTLSVNEYAASEMRYWCRTSDFGGVGYSQPNRWSAYDASNWQGWLTGPGEMDCSAGVAGAYNIAFHECLGASVRPTLFPRSTWTESLRQEAQARGFEDIGDSWTGSTPDGGFAVGDLLLRTTGEGGHVAMVVRDEDDSFDPWNPLIAEAWIDSAGTIYGSDGGDGSAADDSGGESRLLRYGSHPLTVSAAWSTCLRYRGLSSDGSASAPQARQEASGRAFGIDVSTHQAGIDIGATGADFVVVKATEGVGYVDPQFRTLADATVASGKRLGLYHFAWPSANSCEDEVDAFISAIRPYLDQKPFLVLDWEDPDAPYDISWADHWLNLVHRGTGIKPIIYMSASVANNGWWEQISRVYWLWLAGYPADAPDSPATPDCPYVPLDHGWEALMWQYTSTGRVPGWDRDLDLNVCYRPDVIGLGGTPSTDEEWLNMPAAVDHLKTIADAITPGKEGVKHAGAIYLRVSETEAAVLRVEKLLQEGGKKSVYNRLDDLEHYVAAMSADLASVKKSLEALAKNAA